MGVGWCRTGLFALGCALACAGCERRSAGTGTATTTSSSSERGASAASLPSANAAPRPVVPEGARQVAARINRFALELDRAQLASGRGADEQRMIVSPLSIFLALGLAHLGAHGPTRTELAKVLYGDRPNGDMEAHVGDLLRYLKALPDVTLEITNAYWVKKGLRTESDFSNAALERYQAKGQELDFQGDPASAIKHINSWFDGQTRHMIPRVVPDGGLDRTTSSVLTNAVYFLGPWAKPFDPAATTPRKFTDAAGRVSEVPMMRQRVDLPYAETEFARAVLLAYRGHDLGMLVLLPRAKGWFSQPLPADVIEQLLRSVKVRPVELSFPRFDVQSGLELGAALTSLGVVTAFREGADFSAMTRGAPVRLSGVFHRARVRVEEKGTEAAAATGIGVVPVSPPPELVEFVVDRPFLFVIRSEGVGAPLFFGRVGALT